MSDLAKATQKAREFRQREQAILDCALQLFIELGEDKVTVEMIADKVGIGKGTIYKHFETKNEIYLLLMIRYEEELADMFRRLDALADKEALMREYFRFRVQDPDKYLLFDRLESKLMADKAVPAVAGQAARHSGLQFRQADQHRQGPYRRAEAGGCAARVPHLCCLGAWHTGPRPCASPEFYKNFITDPDDFFEFLLSAGIRMGNRNRHGKVRERLVLCQGRHPARGRPLSLAVLTACLSLSCVT
jgi:AcrR family transcriptional regulator